LIKVSPLAGCLVPSCDGATGCEIELPPVDQPCCSEPPRVRVADPVALCPTARALHIGRNSEGFGRLQQCDRMRSINFQQAGATMRFNLAAHCLRIDEPVIMRARMETKDRLVFNVEQPVLMQERYPGYAERLFLSLPVGGRGPFFDLEGAEANFEITLRDADGVEVSERLRVTLTFSRLPDLPDPELASTVSSENTANPTY
jgi:hypothetical protein